MRHVPFAVVVSAAFAAGFPVLFADDPSPPTKTVPVPEVPDDSGKRPDLDAVAKRAVDETNRFRTAEARGPVAVDPQLGAAARYFADYMARADEYGHEADGTTPADRAQKPGYDYCLIAENIAHAFDSTGFDADRLADLFVKGWKESPPHRKNMLDADVTQTAVAVARSAKTGHYYAVQLFGRPKSAAVEFRVANRADAAVKYVLAEKSFDLAPGVTRVHTVCRPYTLEFTWPDGTTAEANAAGGDRLTVAADGGKFAVKKE